MGQLPRIEEEDVVTLVEEKPTKWGFSCIKVLRVCFEICRWCYLHRNSSRISPDVEFNKTCNWTKLTFVNQGLAVTRATCPRVKTNAGNFSVVAVISLGKLPKQLISLPVCLCTFQIVELLRILRTQWVSMSNGKFELESSSSAEAERSDVLRERSAECDSTPVNAGNRPSSPQCAQHLPLLFDSTKLLVLIEWNSKVRLEQWLEPVIRTAFWLGKIKSLKFCIFENIETTRLPVQKEENLGCGESPCKIWWTSVAPFSRNRLFKFGRKASKWAQKATFATLSRWFVR